MSARKARGARLNAALPRGRLTPDDVVHLADPRLSREQSDRLHAGFDDE